MKSDSGSINDYGILDTRKACAKCGWKTNLLFEGLCYDCFLPPEEFDDDEE